MTDAEKALYDGMVARMADRFESAMRHSKEAAEKAAAEIAACQDEFIASMFGAKPPVNPAAG